MVAEQKNSPIPSHLTLAYHGVAEQKNSPIPSHLTLAYAFTMIIPCPNFSTDLPQVVRPLLHGLA